MHNEIQSNEYSSHEPGHATSTPVKKQNPAAPFMPPLANNSSRVTTGMTSNTWD